MRSCFSILDVFAGHRLGDSKNDPVVDFRNNIGSDNLDYGAAYYPWLKTTVFQTNDFTAENLTDSARTVLVNLGVSMVGTTETALRAGSPMYTKIMNAMTEYVNCMPPSAAIAGAYTRADLERGVWKAPANIALESVTGPSVVIPPNLQAGLNVTPSGKSINPIQSFPGRGTLVWGAGTLDGNSLDRRYIHVRRTMTMLEQSIALGMGGYVFEPNDTNTWVTVKSAISVFLTDIWNAGGLAGATTADAFSVSVGLGSTMTADDILAGIMRISVKVAIDKPAEFNEFAIEQKMG